MSKRKKDNLNTNVKKQRLRIKYPKKGNKHYFDGGLAQISEQAISDMRLKVRNDFDREKDEEEFDNFCKTYLSQSGIVSRNYICDGCGVRFLSSNALNGHKNKRCRNDGAIALSGSKWLEFDVARKALFNCIPTEDILSYCDSMVPKISQQRIESAFENIQTVLRDPSTYDKEERLVYNISSCFADLLDLRHREKCQHDLFMNGKKQTAESDSTLIKENTTEVVLIQGKRAFSTVAMKSMFNQSAADLSSYAQRQINQEELGNIQWLRKTSFGPQKKVPLIMHIAGSMICFYHATEGISGNTIKGILTGRMKEINQATKLTKITSEAGAWWSLMNKEHFAATVEFINCFAHQYEYEKPPQPTPVPQSGRDQWSISDVQDWLIQNELETLIQPFSENCVNGESLKNIPASQCVQIFEERMKVRYLVAEKFKRLWYE